MGLKRPVGDTLADIVYERTGHAFRDLRLLDTALTHASAVRARVNNERLEFLGDRVLAIVVAEMLFRQFPDASEGELAPRFSALVDARCLTGIGEEMGLEELVRAEQAVRARRAATRNYLSDAVEALIAAIYLDGGLEAARAFIHRYWQARAHTVVDKPRNPKSELQEWLAQRNGVRPHYVTEEREGPDHEPVFTVAVSAEGFEPARARGRSRRTAEEAAAAEFLMREGVWSVVGATV